MTERPATPGAPSDACTDDGAVSAYEQLRQDALAGSSSAKPLGLVVLLREGVLTWLQRRRSLQTEVTSMAAPAALARTTVPVLADETRAAVVHVLATMTLSSVTQEQQRP